MSLTAVQQILEKVEDRLKTVLVANGYDFDVVKVIKRYPFQALAFQTEDIPAIFFYPSADIRLGAEHGFETRQLTLAIGIYYSTDGDTLIDLSEQLGVVIHLAINRDTAHPNFSDNPSIDLGGIVQNLRLLNKMPLISEETQPWYGAQFEYSLDYQTELCNPFSFV